MPAIFPFRGWRYNRRRIPDLSAVITPPYDVISPADQRDFYDRSPYNCVRLILNREEGTKRYQSAARHLTEWIAAGILAPENQPALYLLAQTFTVGGREVTRIGVIATMTVVPYGQGVLPHEQTFPKTVRDRYLLLEATGANFGQIFLSYRDRQLTVEGIAESVLRESPVIDVHLDQVRHRLWPVSDPGRIAGICAVIGGSTLIVADGHHRYTTALEFRRDHPDLPGAGRVMVTLVNAYNPGMDILPTHRLISGIGERLEPFRQRLTEHFAIEMVADLPALDQLTRRAPAGEVWLGLHFRASGDNLMVKIPSTAPDAGVLHDLLLKPLLGLDVSRPEHRDQVNYLRGADAVTDLLAGAGEFELACLVKPPTLDQVFATAEAGGLMPQKSTYFYPKVYSGLVFRRLAD